MCSWPDACFSVRCVALVAGRFLLKCSAPLDTCGVVLPPCPPGVFPEWFAHPGPGSPSSFWITVSFRTLADATHRSDPGQESDESCAALRQTQLSRSERPPSHTHTHGSQWWRLVGTTHVPRCSPVIEAALMSGAAAGFSAAGAVSAEPASRRVRQASRPSTSEETAPHMTQPV